MKRHERNEIQVSQLTRTVQLSEHKLPCVQTRASNVTQGENVLRVRYEHSISATAMSFLLNHYKVCYSTFEPNAVGIEAELIKIYVKKACFSFTVLSLYVRESSST